MKATISWMYIKPYKDQIPYTIIIDGKEEIYTYLLKLHEYVCDVYVLAEFNGILYDISKPDGENAIKLIYAMESLID